MFKNYLRTQRLSIQIIIFIGFWFALFAVAQGAVLIYIKAAAGIGTDQLQEYSRIGIYKQTDILFTSQVLFQIISFLLPALIYAYLADPNPVKYLGGISPKKQSHYWAIIIIAISMVFAIGTLADLFKRIDFGEISKELDKQRQAFIKAYLTSGNTWTIIRSIFLIAVIPAFCEELFFRGVLMKFMQSTFKKWWLSIGFSALVFAAIHLSISEFVPIFIAGIILGMVYYLTSSIWLSILLHLIFNALNALLGMYDDPALEKSLDQSSVTLTILAVALLPLAAGIYFLYKKRTPLPDNWSVVASTEKTINFDL